MKYQRSDSISWRGIAQLVDHSRDDVGQVLEIDTNKPRMDRAKLWISRLSVWCKPIPVVLFLILASLATSSYYWKDSIAAISSSPCGLLPPQRIDLDRVGIDDPYKVCVVVVIGDDSGVPDFNSLPFSKLRWILQRVLQVAGVQGEVGLVEPDLQGVFVRTDYTDLVCKIARDALGPAVKCESFLDAAPESSQPVSCKTLVVGHSSRYVEQACPAWTSDIFYTELQVVDLDTPEQPAPVTVAEWKPTIVTAFSSNHFKYGLLLLRSINKAAKSIKADYNVSVVAWTMDEFSREQENYLNCVLLELAVSGIHAETRKFPFLDYPPWMRLNKSLIAIHDGGKGEYAWKAIMAHKVLQERGFILWLDAGCRILTPESLTESLNYVKAKGFGGHISEGILQEWTHPGQLKYFQSDYSYLKRQRNCDASRMGFTLDSYSKLFRPWYECSITKQCIAPQGSDRFNHRQDQAALSVLSYSTGLYCKGLSKDVIRHTDNYGFDFYGGVDPSGCYQDPITV